MQQITPEKIHAVVDFLNQQEFVFYSGYPSILHSLAQMALEHGLYLHNPPRAVFAAAENTFSYQKESIAAFTRAPLSDLYGMSEACGNASRCEHGKYHEDFEFGLVQCADGVASDGGGVQGKILCTSFANHAFPLINYETGDIGVWEADTFACPCGRQSAVLARVEGRADDYVLTPEGRQIMRFDYIFKGMDGIKEAQVMQTAPGSIVIRIVRRPSFRAADERILSQRVAVWISPGLSVAFDYVSEIERGSNGKFKAVLSVMPRLPALSSAVSPLTTPSISTSVYS
jgi:phenylacetate-CoA ligase